MRRVAFWLIPALLAVALYAITIPGTFTYDDVYTCKDDPRLTPPSEWGKYFYQGYFPDGADNLWRPLVSLTYAFQTWAHGPRAWAFHLVNVILHGIATAMVALLAARLAGRKIGLLAGLFFAAHPVHVEAVAGIVGRAEEMALIGIMWALLLFIDRPMTRGRAVGIVACFLFAVGCKEQGLLIPPMLLAWWFLRRRRIAQPQAVGATEHYQLDYAGHLPKGESSQASRLLVGLLTLTMAAYILYRNHILPWFWEKGFLDPALNPLAITTGIDRWLIPVAILGRYVELLFVPTHFSLDYGMSVFTTKLNWQEPYFYIGLIALAACVVAIIYLWRRGKTVALFALICFALVYFLVSNVLLIGTIMGERLMYVPSAFFCVLLAMAIARLPRGALVLVTACLLVLGAVRLETYAYQWNTEERLYRYAVASQPKASMPYLLLAGQVSPQEADRLLARARAECPDASQVWGKSAWCKIALGQLDAAEDFAMKSFRLRPGNTDAMGALREIQIRRQATQPASRPRR
jgi:hypothetical protein